MPNDIYCNLCGEGYPVEDIGLVYGQITCVGCADGMGEELKDRGMEQQHRMVLGEFDSSPMLKY